MASYNALLNHHSEWQSEKHPFAEVVSLNITRDVGTVMVVTDNGCYFTLSLKDFLAEWWPFVRPSAWDYILAD